MSTLENLINEINAAKKKFQEEGKSALQSAFKQFFEENPEVTAVGWLQYAPYFNDGEPCEFSVHDIYATTIPLDHEDYSSSELAHGEYEYGDSDCDWSPNNKKVDEFLRLLSRVPDDLFEHLFGSDSIVTVTRDGIDVEDYSDHN